MSISAKEKAKEIYDNIEAELINSISDYFTRNRLCKILSQQSVDQIIDSSPSLPILSDGGSFGSDIEESVLLWKEVKTLLEGM